MGSDVKGKMKKALVRLFEKKHYLQITVTDLVKEAGVARASFYRVYNTIDDVVDDILYDISNSATKNLLPLLLDGSEESVKASIIQVLNKMKAREIPYIGLVPENAEMLTARYTVSIIFHKKENTPGFVDKYLSAIHLSIFLSVCRTWAHYGYKETAEELADFLYDYVFKGEYRNVF